MKCVAAIVPEVGKPLVLEEVDIADPKPNEVRVKIKTCTICHSDIHSARGEHGPFEGSATAGHEVAGVVDAVGSAVTYVKPGDRVIAGIERAGCGKCYECLSGRPAFCESLDGHIFKQKGPYTRKNGEIPIQLAGYLTGFAEYTNVLENSVYKLDDAVPFEIGSMISCGFIAGFGAVVNRLQVRPFQSIVVVGCGGVGLSAIQGAHFVGAFPIIAVDTSDDKLNFAKTMGATHILNPMKCNIVEEVHSICYGRGADNAIVCTAGKGLKKQAFDMCTGYGHTCFVGHGDFAEEFLHEFNCLNFMDGAYITGSAMGATNVRIQIPQIQEIYKFGLLHLDEMITHRFTLSEINEALDDAVHGQGVIKNLVVIDPS